MLETEADMSTSIVLLGGLAILIAIILIVPVFMKSRNVNLTDSKEEKPEWMQTTPPAETVNATKSENKGVTLYDHDEGEQLAAPFAEQIEDVLRAKLKSNPALKNFEIDFGTGKDGSLEIWVNGEKYGSVDVLPDEELKKAFRAAVKEWNSKK
jgi:hypothetical protein